MEMDNIDSKERYELLTQIAEMYYKEGKTQTEIANYFDTNRFKVAKLLQDALNEQIVEIKINYSNERNKLLEEELKNRFELNEVLIINNQYLGYIEGINSIGKTGAEYFSSLLKHNSVIGVTWGKMAHSVISHLKPSTRYPIKVVELTGYSGLINPEIDSRKLISMMASTYRGSYKYFMAPIYVGNSELKRLLLEEPVVKEALELTKKMDIILSGISGNSNLPMFKKSVEPYLTEKDKSEIKNCIGSIYGYVLDKNGDIADIDLNKKLISTSIEDIFNTKHRILVSIGKYKLEVMVKAARKKFYNELITTSEIAMDMLEYDKKI
ncbi:MAG: hypothetical protein KBA67_07260 [Leptotrichiaceae bacterium]|nr:hypothetical protein [Leptotrichiaceae bacterium]MBP6281974.1 hypothetical protein [Leptotrichiaceae bacterium]MBP7101310.1 hypothetical protein [Leptotrichiaceae bacterium]MBP7739537.1 hypothetical protein [Leptotrichiaceae bacterium]MBP9629730.1 hypothetical protein [Leptotrichiaceae bacterium]